MAKTTETEICRFSGIYRFLKYWENSKRKYSINYDTIMGASVALLLLKNEYRYHIKI